MQQVIEQFSETIRKAAAEHTHVRIRGSGAKDFYGLALIGDVLDTRPCTGIVEYEPTELVLTACAGTPLRKVEAALAKNTQMLPFEPPHFGAAATLGGSVACGFSGPRRAAAGSARDFVLGVRMLNGLGEDLRFGGQVMKNVAGYDLSRLMTGSFGTLGLITEVSLKVLPVPEQERTLRLEMDEATALDSISRWAGKPLPLSASCHVDGTLYLRLSGAGSAVEAAQKKLGGDPVADGVAFWQSIREQTHPFFAGAAALWRLSIKPTAPPLGLGPQLIEWNGGLRWIAGDLSPSHAFETAQRASGHATLFRGGDKRLGIQRLPANLLAIHKKLKRVFDPEGILSPGRIHADF
ncbi:MAG TPA: glycolate oxidase subunit GlcE [Burkholderiales bacterium]|jgi:glycolate oxidase FAD binding subunit|nr:glycolate oxidase subunit GlcE [Burkholderiales bacterium]